MLRTLCPVVWMTFKGYLKEAWKESDGELIDRKEDLK